MGFATATARARVTKAARVLKLISYMLAECGSSQVVVEDAKVLKGVEDD
jgi:hypothetical protein